MHELAVFLQDIVARMGYPGVFLLVTLESTLVPVPSELVFPFAGFLASKGVFSLPVILVINSVGAMVGSGIGYWIGAAGGKPLLLKYGKYLLIRRHDIEKTERWFANHGKATIFFARLVPVVRHIISLPAGVARMPLRAFFVQTFLGATLWGSFLVLLGYYLGEHWEAVANKLKRFDLVLGVLIVVAVLVFAVRIYIKRRRERGAVENNAD
ncbi:MAG TPA: DedA family protein [Kofleriaceae bacterium]|nr:DedA family protein [Kofleriaceae bacterium]